MWLYPVCYLGHKPRSFLSSPWSTPRDLLLNKQRWLPAWLLAAGWAALPALPAYTPCHARTRMPAAYSRHDAETFWLKHAAAQQQHFGLVEPQTHAPRFTFWLQYNDDKQTWRAWPCFLSFSAILALPLPAALQRLTDIPLLLPAAFSPAFPPAKLEFTCHYAGGLDSWF